MNHSSQFYHRTEQRLYFNPGGVDGEEPLAPAKQPFAPQHPYGRPAPTPRPMPPMPLPLPRVKQIFHLTSRLADLDLRPLALPRCPGSLSCTPPPPPLHPAMLVVGP